MKRSNFKEEDIFSKAQFLDTYGKIYAQTKKNLDAALDNALNTADISEYSSDCTEYEEQQVFDGKNVNLFFRDGSSPLTLPKEFLEIDDLTDFFDASTLKEVFSDPQSAAALAKFLPQNISPAEQQKTVQEICQGKPIHLGINPMKEFLKNAKEGSFTSWRSQELAIQKKIGKASLAEYYQKTKEELKAKLVPEKIAKVKTLLMKRRAQKNIEELMSNCGSDSVLSDASLIDIRAEVDFEDVSQGNSTDGSSDGLDESKRRRFQHHSGNNNISSNNNNPNNTQISHHYDSPSHHSDNSQHQDFNHETTGSRIRNNFNNSSSRVIDQPTPYYKTKKSKAPVSKEWLENYRAQERLRYANPTKPWVFTCQDGSHTCVSPVCKKLNGSQQSRPRDHAFLKQKRSPFITILSLVRDACARMVNGQGTRFDICELLKESQYINSDLKYEKVSIIVSGALDRLHYLEDPCIKYETEKKVWHYLHRDRDENHPAWKNYGTDNFNGEE